MIRWSEVRSGTRRMRAVATITQSAGSRKEPRSAAASWTMSAVMGTMRKVGSVSSCWSNSFTPISCPPPLLAKEGDFGQAYSADSEVHPVQDGVIQDTALLPR